MKNLIEFYYSFVNIRLNKEKNIYYFTYNNKKYIFKESKRSIEELMQIYFLTINDLKYNKLIFEKNKMPSIGINNKQYIMEEIVLNDNNITENDILQKYEIQNINDYKNLMRDDWYNLWSKKVDYIQYQRIHLRGKYNILEQYLDYYIGLSENAISYIFDTKINEKKDERDKNVISHRRIYSLKKEDFYDVNEIVIDHYVRDICEYIKYIFFYKNADFTIINNIIKKINLSKYGYRLLFSRMLFPTYFFDIYEEIVNEQKKEKEINNILLKIEKYEILLRFIFKEINKKTRIPSINWISS